jgi:DNA-binding transcriptional LysR family regulator
MTNAGIEAFLIVCKQHSISKAAAELFISQSSLSIRLRTLEKEVGCPLFFRHKGSREMVLTEEGKRFYQLSLQYQDIVRSMLAIGNRKSSLRLSALNSVSTYLLPPVYEQFMRDHPDIHLEIQDMTVEAACQSLLRGETDLAFTSDVPRTDAIRAELVMTEPMALICAAGSCYSDGIGPDELPVRQEVYVGWTDEFARWHQELWGVDAVPRIQLEIMSQLQMFMTKRDSWAVVPRSVADGLCAAGGRRLAAAFPLPERRIHALQKKAVSLEAAQLFLGAAQPRQTFQFTEQQAIHKVIEPLGGFIFVVQRDERCHLFYQSTLVRFGQADKGFRLLIVFHDLSVQPHGYQLRIQRSHFGTAGFC